MEKNNGQPTGHVGPFYEKDYEYLYGSHIGTGSGASLDWQELQTNGRVFSGYELVEVFSRLVHDRPFRLDIMIAGINTEINDGFIIMVEHPTRNNQLGKLKYRPRNDIDHDALEPIWFRMVKAGTYPLHIQ
jgi:hypothetical protein